MFKRALSFLFLGIVGAVPFVVFGEETAATTTFQTLSQIPGVAGSTVSIGTYVNALFRIAIGLGAVIAVLMIVIGGFEYLSTDMFQRKSAGKERIQNSLLGLGLLLVSTLLLQTINPKLLDLSFQPLKAEITFTSLNAPGVYTSTQTCISTEKYNHRAGYHQPATSGECFSTAEECAASETALRDAQGSGNFDRISCTPRQVTVEFDGCSNCVPAGQICPAFNGNPCRGGQRACLLSGTLAGPVAAAGSATGRRITCTEVWPPAANHRDLCHSNGTCLDFRLGAPGVISEPSDIWKTIQAFQNSGGCAVYEVSSNAQRDALRARGRSLVGTPGFDLGLYQRRIITVAGVAPHFSGYNSPIRATGNGTRPSCR